jgi:hypothetical protein
MTPLGSSPQPTSLGPCPVAAWERSPTPEFFEDARGDAIRWAELRDYTTAPDPARRHAIEDMFRVYVETVGQLRALLAESAYHELLSICHTTRQAPPGRSN